MFGIKRTDRVFIDEARVACPLTGSDVSIEECMTCGKLRNIVDDDLPYVICAGRRTDLRADAVL